MLRGAFGQRDANSSSTPEPKRARVRRVARVEYSLEKHQFDAMMDALGPHAKSVMQGLLDSHRGPKSLLVPADIWREYLGALAGVRSDQTAGEIETVALRQQLDKEIALRRDAERALRRITVYEAEPGFSPFAIRALCDDTPEGRGGVLPPLGFSEAIAKLSRGEVVAPSVVAQTWHKLGAFMTALKRFFFDAHTARRALRKRKHASIQSPVSRTLVAAPPDVADKDRQGRGHPMILAQAHRPSFLIQLGSIELLTSPSHPPLCVPL
jgi:hypothetical protein